MLLWWLWRREGRRTGETNRTIWLLIPGKVPLKIAETDQLYQEKRMLGGIGGRVCSRSFLKLKMDKIQGFLWGTSLGSSDYPTWANFGKQNWRCHLACSVCVVRCVLCCWCAMCGCWRVCWCVLVLVCHADFPLPLSLPSPSFPSPLSVRTFKTSLCVRAPRPQVLPHAGAVPVHMETS